jgi:hypothetical protein
MGGGARPNALQDRVVLKCGDKLDVKRLDPVWDEHVDDDVDPSVEGGSDVLVHTLHRPLLDVVVDRLLAGHEAVLLDVKPSRVSQRHLHPGPSPAQILVNTVNEDEEEEKRERVCVCVCERESDARKEY